MHPTIQKTKAIAPFLRKWKKERKSEKQCVVCGDRMFAVLQKHHIDGNNKNNKPDNLCYLCGSCHTLTFKPTSVKEALYYLKLRNKRSRISKNIWRNVGKKRRMWSNKKTSWFPHGIRVRAKR